MIHCAVTALIGSVWVFHGLFSKLLDGIPRHRMIVERVLGESFGATVTMLIGAGEVIVGLWVFTRILRRFCASVQTVALIAMNLLEVMFARDLLLSAPGMLALNAAFISLIWWWALSNSRGSRQPA